MLATVRREGGAEDQTSTPSLKPVSARGLSCLSFIRTCDLNQELEDRGIDVPKFASKAWKMRMLDDLTHEVRQHGQATHHPQQLAD